jgi:hypothetical protein
MAQLADCWALAALPPESAERATVEQVKINTTDHLTIARRDFAP